MRAAVCSSFGAPLAVEQLQIRAPSAHEVLVRVEACAICHSDVAYAEGAWGGTLPAVYGHEAAGVVEEVGCEVSGLRPGDRVVVTLIRSCGTCRRCRQGRPALCAEPPSEGPGPTLSRPDGSPVHQGMRTAAFAELVTVHRSQVVDLPLEVSPEAACLLACGVLTGFGAVTNTAGVEAGSRVVVLGTGGVGLNCVQGAALAGASQVVAVDVVDKKLTAARHFGASDTVDSSASDAVEAVAEITGGHGADYVFVAAGLARLVEDGARMLGRGAALVLVGMTPSGATVSLDPLVISDSGQRVIGSKMGDSDPARDIPRLVGLYQAGRLKLDELISQRFELDRIDEAMASARRGEQLRAVVSFGPSERA